MRPNIGTTYLRIMPKNLRRRFYAKAAEGPFGIIEYSVLLYHLLCLRWIFKEISTEAFIPKLAIKAFKAAVLPRTAFFGKFMAYAIFLNKLPKSQASELRTLICSDDSGNAIKPDAIFKYFHHGFSRNTELAINAQRKPAEEILYSHDLNASAVHKGVKEEINRPDMIAIQRLCQRHLHSNQLFVSTGSVSLQVEVFIDAIDFFAVSRDASPVYRNMNAPVAVKGVLKSYFLYYLGKGLIMVGFERAIIQSADWHFNNVSSFSCGYTKLNHLFSYHSPFMNGQKFFLTISLRTCISSSFSARILLSLRFSSSRTLSLLASLEDLPLNFCFHFSKELLLTEYLRQTSAIELLGSSASERICIILSTGYFVCFIVYTPFLDYIRIFVVPKNGVQVTYVSVIQISFSPPCNVLLLRNTSFVL